MDFPSSCYIAVSFFTPPLLLNLCQFGLHCQHSAELDLLDVRSHGPLLSALVMQSALYRCTVGQVSPLKILSSDDFPSISLPGSFPLFTLQMLNIFCAHSQPSLPHGLSLGSHWLPWSPSRPLFWAPALYLSTANLKSSYRCHLGSLKSTRSQFHCNCSLIWLWWPHIPLSFHTHHSSSAILSSSKSLRKLGWQSNLRRC